ncbi:hypothetical protein LJC59_08500, partial [Desulfovibrio sp. OttesenSCG-928-A18]|nr:hypothetical protein [Desulfovibrio sp. OttesenSCG-928-A18]
MDRRYFFLLPCAALVLLCLYLGLNKDSLQSDAARAAQIPAYEGATLAQKWTFANYGYSFMLPEARNGFVYPKPGMEQGVLFFLNPPERQNERRELIVWAYDLPPGNAGVSAQLRADLQILELHEPGAEKAAAFFRREQAGLGFHGYTTQRSGRRYLTAMAQAGAGAGSVVYAIHLASSQKNWDRDYKLFQHVFAS